MEEFRGFDLLETEKEKGERQRLYAGNPNWRMVWATKTFFFLSLNKIPSMIPEKYSTASFLPTSLNCPKLNFRSKSPEVEDAPSRKNRKKEDEIGKNSLPFSILRVMFLILNWFMFSIMSRRNEIGAKCWCTGMRWASKRTSEKGRNYDFGISVMFFVFFLSCSVYLKTYMKAGGGRRRKGRQF